MILFFQYILLLLSLLFMLGTIGIYVPHIPLISDYSRIINSFFSTHIVVWSSFLLLLNIFLFWYSRNTLALSTTLLSVFQCIGVLIPLICVFFYASQLGVNISLRSNLHIVVNRGTPNLETSVAYAQTEGKELLLEITPAHKTENGKNKPLLLIHGWGFVEGARGQEPLWTEYFSQRWYTVFDIDYRLADYTHHTYNLAARDVTTASVWIANHAETYQLDMSEFIIVGSSAGASLALQSSYAGETLFPAYIPGDIPKVKKIIAFFPATDMEALWDQDTRFLDIASRDVGMQYVGGSPTDFPREYEIINTAKIVHPQVPETLILHGKHDALIPYQTLFPLQRKLEEMKVPYTILYIP